MLFLILFYAIQKFPKTNIVTNHKRKKKSSGHLTTFNHVSLEFPFLSANEKKKFT